MRAIPTLGFSGTSTSLHPHSRDEQCAAMSTVRAENLARTIVMLYKLTGPQLRHSQICAPIGCASHMGPTCRSEKGQTKLKKRRATAARARFVGIGEVVEHIGSIVEASHRFAPLGLVTVFENEALITPTCEGRHS